MRDTVILQPRAHNKLYARFGLFPFRSPLLRESQGSLSPRHDCSRVHKYHTMLSPIAGLSRYAGSTSATFRFRENREESNPILLSSPPGTEMFHFPGYAFRLTPEFLVLHQKSFLIRKSPDRRLLGTSPKLIAATPRPSSPSSAKASTICSY